MRRYTKTKYGKVFRCKKGKHKGKLVKYAYRDGRKRMVLHKTGTRLYRRRY